MISEMSKEDFPRSLLYAIFLTVYMIAAAINHIDDTDETYGYWEPLHYLLYGRGMQTWEYSPEFSIRTYAFIFPIYIIGTVLKTFQIPKLAVFYTIRAILGIFTTYSIESFLKSYYHCFGTRDLIILLCFLLFSPGIFYCSTSFLPSAVSLNLLLLSTSKWMVGDFISSIAFGGFAVFWTGWPFVGLMFLPLGFHMIYMVFSGNPNIPNTFPRQFSSGLLGLLKLVFAGLFTVFVVAAPALIIDFYFYRKWTIPTWNILLYNAFSTNQSDELYGVEPTSYYVKNLFLNLGFTWVFVIISPFVSLVDFYSTKFFFKVYERVEGEKGNRQGFQGFFIKLTIWMQGIIWLVVLFLRPHKEERFLYPAYGTLCFIATDSCARVLSIFDNILTHLLLTSDFKSIKEENQESGGGSHVRKLNLKRVNVINWLKFLFLLLIFSLSGSLFISRVTSNFNNYKGYMALWRDISYNFNYLKPKHSKTQKFLKTQKISLCTGREWYIFPSHFFLPNHIDLHFFPDNFRGILPQYFSEFNGTFSEPIEPFNDKNQEERSRYMPLNKCDFLILTVDRNFPPVEVHKTQLIPQLIGGNEENCVEPDKKVLKNNVLSCSGFLEKQAENIRNKISILSAEEFSFKSIKSLSKPAKPQIFNKKEKKQKIITTGDFNSESGFNEKIGEGEVGFSLLIGRKVLSVDASKSSVLRAFYVPFLSEKSVKYKDYLLLKQSSPY